MKERTIALINLLLLSKLPVQMDQLQKDLQVSARTIRNDIASLNEFLEKYHLPKVQSIRSKGFQLELSEQEEKIFRSYLRDEEMEDYLTREERIVDILLDIALSVDPVFLYRKEEEYRVSKSTIDEDMRQLRQRLISYHVQIVSLPKIGLVLEGKESTIRTMLYAFISSALARDKERFELSRPDIIERYIEPERIQMLDNLFENTIYSIGDQLHRLHFNLFTCIWMGRIMKGQLVEATEVPTESVKDIRGIKEYLHRICTYYSLIPTVTELDYIYAMLQSFHVKEEYSPINWLQLQMLTLQLIHFVTERTGVPFSKKENSLQESLYRHLISMVSRIENNIQLTNPLTDKIRQSYGVIYEAVQVFSTDLAKQLGKTILEDEIAFLAIHFSAALSEMNQENQYWYRAVVICNHGVATGKLLSENLREFFNIEVFAVLSSKELAIVDKLDVDLVFSTVEITYTQKPLLIVDSLIQESTKVRILHFLAEHSEARRVIHKRNDYTVMFQELLHIVGQIGDIDTNYYLTLSQLFKEYDLTINIREVQPMIQDILTDDSIQVVTKEYDWPDAIKLVGQPLLDKSIITQNYVSAMINSVSEYGPYIVIGPHLALAHARPQDGANELGLSVAVFEKPVYFGPEEEQQVSVIFCLSAVDAFSHLNIMKSLVNLIRHTDKIEQLSRARHIETVKQILFHSYKEEE
ncbi:BglG family transcription antiterminator [Streptococcus sp. ZJ100]|uniref:BglG family transcription antiterminator n=1 Tax=Streptococcus handemini TaxID=3161188 RepID=UPI0032EDF559